MWAEHVYIKMRAGFLPHMTFVNFSNDIHRHNFHYPQYMMTDYLSFSILKIFNTAGWFVYTLVDAIPDTDQTCHLQHPAVTQG